MVTSAKEELLKDKIITIFSEHRKEPSSDRRQTDFGRLCTQIYIWCRDYRFKNNINKMGLEISNVTKRIMKDENLSKIPDEKDDFFKYLNTSINREKAAYHRESNENDTIKIPKEKKQKLREIEDFVSMKESQLGRQLTSDEKILAISKWFKKQEYIDLLNVLQVGSISYTSNDGDNEIDALNYLSPTSDDPLSEYLETTDKELAMEAVKTLIENKNKESSRDCYRALFTLHCIESYKGFENLYPVLDSKILETWRKNGIKPKQYEIYQEYHTNAQKSSAEAMASKNLRDFLNEIEAYLKENH